MSILSILLLYIMLFCLFYTYFLLLFMHVLQALSFGIYYYLVTFYVFYCKKSQQKIFYTFFSAAIVSFFNLLILSPKISLYPLSHSFYHLFPISFRPHFTVFSKIGHVPHCDEIDKKQVANRLFSQNPIMFLFI